MEKSQYHTESISYIKKQNKILLYVPLLLGLSSQHPTPRQPRQPLGGSPQGLPISPELSSFLRLTCPRLEFVQQTRSLRLSGLLFLRRQRGALRNNFALSYRYLYIQRGKSAQLCNTLFSPGVGSRSIGAFSLFSSVLFEYFMKRMFCFFPILSLQVMEKPILTFKNSSNPH